MDDMLKHHLINRVEQANLFSKHFGSFNKSDYEVLMFTVYLDSIEGEVRDYDISIALGIPESKVRTLRVKSQLLYPKEIDWVDILAKALSNGIYDDGMVTITIEDPSARNRIRYEVEKQYGMVGLSLNSKQMILPIESFIMLAACAESNADDVIEKLNGKLHERYPLVKKIEKKNIRTRFLKPIKDTTSFLSDMQQYITSAYL